MNINLHITGWATCGSGAEQAPDAHREPLPGPGTRRRGGRAALLAAALCRRALATAPAGSTAPDRTSVLFGTALGCLTETQLFVEHMIQAEEATPKPRAFSASVHNAIASTVALELGARGECQTFAHGEASFAHALFAAAAAQSRSDGPLLVGAVDEQSDYVARGIEACGGDPSLRPGLGEGGAALLLSSAGPVRIRQVLWGRPSEPMDWLARHTDPKGQTFAVPSLNGQPHRDTTDPFPFTNHHASLLATATALSAGILAGSVDPAAVGCARAPSTINLLSCSHLGDTALITLTNELS